MRTAELDYHLPEALIARYPAAEREGSRLLVVDGDALHDARFSELPTWLPEGALLVVNDTRVLRARLFGKKASGGRTEVLLVEREGASALSFDGVERPCELWRALVRAAGRPGIELELGALGARVLERPDAEGLTRLALFARAEPASAGAPPSEAALAHVAALREREGHMPLPPYLGRGDEALDTERYQTIFGDKPGAVAAPTAGLHFSAALCARLEASGRALARVTLHVGPGTFRPVTADDLDSHAMHAEPFEVPDSTAQAIAAARARGAPVIAVGTTVVRALESAPDEAHPGRVVACRGTTKLLIQPGYRFKVVDGLITNFHLPGSTLLALVYAFGGRARVRAAYDAAIARRYRFYSYGDAMYLRRAVAGAGAAA